MANLRISPENLEKIAFLAFPLFIYAIGFIVWNSYLSRFGVFEYEFLQIRFLSAGLISACWLSIPAYFLVPKNLKSKISYFGIFLRVSVFVVVLFSYSQYIFPTIPSYIGGGKPVAISLLGDPDQISYLRNFSISSVENRAGAESLQSGPVCLLYQNSEYLLIGTIAWSQGQNLAGGQLGRILFLKKDLFKGFQVKGGFINHVPCIAAVFYKV